jgi:hypothetical protein
LLWAYHKISPIDDSRGDLQAGIIASTVARCAGNKDASPMDFMPFEKRDDMSDEQRFEKLANMLEASRG